MNKGIGKVANVTNPLHKGSHKLSAREKAIANLAKIKKNRKGKKYKLIMVDFNTWREVEIKDET